jgi:hypothetical protein
MTKKELIEMLSEVPDDSEIRIIETDLFSLSIYSKEIKGYYEDNGFYVLCGFSVRPYKVREHD